MGSGVSRHYKYGIRTGRYFDRHVFPKSQDLFATLWLSHHRSLQIFRAFVAIDIDKSGDISLKEFHRFLGIQKSAFTERLFGVLDKDQSGQLEFHEFLIGVWNICTYDSYLLAKFVFDIFDVDLVGNLSVEECDALLRMIHNTKLADLTLMNHIQAYCRNGKITLESFTLLIEKQPEILRPAFDVQHVLRTKLCGENYWVRRMNKRKKKFGTRDIPVGAAWESVNSYLLSQDELNGSPNEKITTQNATKTKEPVETDHTIFYKTLDEERHERSLKHKLELVEKQLRQDYTVEQAQKRKQIRHRLWKLVDEVQKASQDTIHAKLKWELDFLANGRQADSDESSVSQEYSDTESSLGSEENKSTLSSDEKELGDKQISFSDTHETAATHPRKWRTVLPKGQTLGRSLKKSFGLSSGNPSGRTANASSPAASCRKDALVDKVCLNDDGV